MAYFCIMESPVNIDVTYGLSEQEVSSFLDIGKCIFLKKGETLKQPDKFNDNLHLVVKGILRTYTFSDGENKTAWFTFSGEFLIDLNCYKLGKRSPLGFEAATDATVFLLSKRDFENWCRQSVCNSETGRKIFEGLATIYDHRVTEYFDVDKAADRYRIIMSSYPEILREIPLNHLATYLGVTPQSLSRIRHNIQ